MAEKKAATAKFDEKKHNTTCLIACGVIGVVAVVLLVIFVIPLVVNECDSPCRGAEPGTVCTTVCVRTSHTLWEEWTGQ